MIAVIDWFPVALLGLGFLTGLAVVMILAQPFLHKLHSEVYFWRGCHDRIANECSRMQALIEAHQQLNLALRNKLAEREGSYTSNEDGDWWKVEGGSPFGQENEGGN